jgi:hypothetical protein
MQTLIIKVSSAELNLPEVNGILDIIRNCWPGADICIRRETEEVIELEIAQENVTISITSRNDLAHDGQIVRLPLSDRPNPSYPAPKPWPSPWGTPIHKMTVSEDNVVML